MSLTNQCSLQSTNCKITCDMLICYAGDNTSIMQIYDCTVVAYIMVLQKQIGKIGTPFLIDFICCIFFSNTLCGLPCSYSGVFGSCSKHLDRY